MEDSVEMDDFRRFEKARVELELFLEAHSGSTKDEILEGLGWPPEKVDILLDLLMKWGVAIPSKDSSGEVRYQYEDFWVALVRRLKRERGQFGTPSPVEAKEESKDHFMLLREMGLLSEPPLEGLPFQKSEEVSHSKLRNRRQEALVVHSPEIMNMKGFRKKIIVVDTSFLVNYYFVGKLEFLCEVFEQLVIAPTVWQECQDVSKRKWSDFYPDQTLTDVLKTLNCLNILSPKELSHPEVKLVKTLLQTLTGIQRVSETHKGEMESLAILLLRDNIDFLISDNDAPFTLRNIAVRQLPMKPFASNYPHLKMKLTAIRLDGGLYPVEESIRQGVITSLPALRAFYTDLYIQGRPIYPEEDIKESQDQMRKLLEAYETTRQKKEHEKEELKFKTTEEIEEDFRRQFMEKPLEALRKSRAAHWEERRESARQARIKSFNERWEVIKQKCTEQQIAGIKYFVFHGDYHESAEIAGMSVGEFMGFLDELELVRCQ